MFCFYSLLYKGRVGWHLQDSNNLSNGPCMKELLQILQLQPKVKINFTDNLMFVILAIKLQQLSIAEAFMNVLDSQQ